MRFSTKSIHKGEEPDYKNTGDVVSPIHLATTFARKDISKPPKGYEYARTGNPTRHALEERLAAMEDGKYGFAFSSGSGATTTALMMLKRGDHVVAFDDLYGGTKRLFNIFKNFGIDFTLVDARDTSKVEKSIRKNTKLIWIETPTNPLLKLCDIKEISKIAKSRKIRTLVDNTFASPYLQNPLSLGADIVLHSTTKYLGGHSDVVGGAMITKDKKISDEIKFMQNANGAVPAPFDCFMTMRGTKTLSVRMKQHCQNALEISDFLESHNKVKSVTYPGIKSHPQYDLAKKQMRYGGGMVTFEIKGGLSASKKFLSSLKIFYLAESLGGVESLIEHPAMMTHSGLPKKERLKLGISDGLIRVSVGIEDSQDLIDDMQKALKKI